jgi:phosphoribosylformylglycinamidine cyclo-ligase
MHRVFNCGIGMVLIVAAADAPAALAQLQAAGERSWLIGAVRPSAPGEAPTVVL